MSTHIRSVINRSRKLKLIRIMYRLKTILSNVRVKILLFKISICLPNKRKLIKSRIRGMENQRMRNFTGKYIGLNRQREPQTQTPLFIIRNSWESHIKDPSYRRERAKNHSGAMTKSDITNLLRNTDLGTVLLKRAIPLPRFYSVLFEEVWLL